MTILSFVFGNRGKKVACLYITITVEPLSISVGGHV